MRAQAPDWYEARKTEFRGEGYPSIFSVPQKDTEITTRCANWNCPRKRHWRRWRLFNNDPRAALAEETPEEIMAWALDVRRAVEGRLPAPDFMTDAEVEEIKARFNVPRARL